MAANAAAFARRTLRQKVLRDVSAVDTSVTLMGQQVSMPLALAPVGMAGMFARRGEAQAARAACRAGVPFTTSTVGICTVEEIQAASRGPFWFQLYMLRDRDVVLKMLERAARAGCETLMFTVDLPVPGMRLRDYRNGMLDGGRLGAVAKAVALAASPFWLYDVGIKGKPHTFGNLESEVSDPEDLESYMGFIQSQFDPSCTWQDIAWLREQWTGRILIKGIMEADDARAAVDVGADGVIVSNHGGRQLDGVAATLDKLPAVAEAVGGTAEVLIDGGVRSGLDVLKAVALGARGVLIGRPWVYAMAARGETGVFDLLRVMQKEFATGMALMGVNRVDEITADCLDSG